MMKKFEEYLLGRIKEMRRLEEFYEKIADTVSDHPAYDKERNDQKNLSFEYQIRARENTKVLNHFRQSVEAQSIEGEEPVRGIDAFRVYCENAICQI
jgi:hypothetical protein